MHFYLRLMFFQCKQKFKKISDLFKKGEKICDEEFFGALIGTLDFNILNQNTLKKVRDMLINL